jgi:catechol 2,3-dioxygenase-like lactoylglutathione lyase family enzyme
VPRITQIGRVIVPVADQDEAIAFYTSKLGFSVTADVPFGETTAGSRSRRPQAEPRLRCRRRRATTSLGA